MTTTAPVRFDAEDRAAMSRLFNPPPTPLEEFLARDDTTPTDATPAELATIFGAHA